MTYRKWAYEDILQIAELEKECFSDPWTYRMLADSFFNESVRTVAAEEDGRIVGYGFITAAGEDADLANIAVREAYRRKGIAGKILDALEEEAVSLGVERMFLEVRVSNAAAMLLYLQHGYVGRYVRPRYYGDGEDALIMEKALKKRQE